MNYNQDIYWALFPLITFCLAVCAAFVYFALTYARRPKTPEVLERLHKSFLKIFIFEFWYWLSDPLVKFCAFFKITPNMVTALSIPMSLLAGYLMMIGKFEFAGFMIMFSANMDLLDGRLARLTGKTTKSGAYFDACMDRYNDAFVMGGFGLYFILKNSTTAATSSFKYGTCFVSGSCSTSVLSQTFTISMFEVSMLIASILLIMGTCAMSYAKARGEALGISTKRGLMQRPERVVSLGLFMVLFPFMKIICDNNSLNADYILAGMLVLMTVLVNFSAIVRIIDVFRKIKKMESNSN